MYENMITVFTPVYNRGYCVKNVYDSLLKQTYNNFEWIVINDGSSDNTENVIMECMKEEKIKIRYFYQTNGGQHRALNAGIDKAGGDLFMIVDSDDYLTDDALYWINYYENTIVDKEKMAGVSGLRCHRDGSAIKYEWKNKNDYIDALNIKRYLNKELLGDKAEAYYTSVLKKYYPIPTFEGENDVEKGLLWNRIANAGYKIRWFNKKIYICEYLENGMSKNIINNYVRNFNGYTLYEKEHVHLAIGVMEKLRIVIRYCEVSGIKEITDEQIIQNLEIKKYYLSLTKLIIKNKQWILAIVRFFKHR